MIEEDSYIVTSKHYDASYTAKTNLVDIPFYLPLAEEDGGPVLEIGCGTGRILLPIARKGISITGVDQSRSMLSVLEANLAEEEESVRSKVNLQVGDMRNLDLQEKFSLAIIPFRPFQHMHTMEDQLAALASVKRHLANDGRLVLDMFFPKFDKAFSGIGEEFLELSWENDDGDKIERYFRKDSISKVNLSFTGAMIYRTYRNGKLILEEENELTMTFFTYPQMLALFKLSSLEIVNTYGSFDKRTLDDSSPEMIFEVKSVA